MESLCILLNFQMMYKSKFYKIDPYDCFFLVQSQLILMYKTAL